MEEKLISFETAMVAKEKGFDCKVKNFYNDERELCESDNRFLDNYNDNSVANRRLRFDEDDEENYVVYSAPTQSLLQKWLREKYDIHIGVTAFTNEARGVGTLKYQKHISTKDNNYGGDLENSCDRLKTNNPFLYLYDSYEEALEIGLNEGLKLISNDSE